MKKLTLVIGLVALVLVSGSSATLAALRIDVDALAGAGTAARIVLESGAARLAWLNEELYPDATALQLGPVPRSVREDDLLNAAITRIAPVDDESASLQYAFSTGEPAATTASSSAGLSLAEPNDPDMWWVGAETTVWSSACYDEGCPIAQSDAHLNFGEPDDPYMWRVGSESEGGRRALCAGGDCLER